MFQNYFNFDWEGRPSMWMWRAPFNWPLKLVLQSVFYPWQRYCVYLWIKQANELNQGYVRLKFNFFHAWNAFTWCCSNHNFLRFLNIGSFKFENRFFRSTYSPKTWPDLCPSLILALNMFMSINDCHDCREPIKSIGKRGSVKMS